jgi:hypothetical protein
MLRELATITYPDGTNQVLLAAFENWGSTFSSNPYLIAV